MKCINKKEQFEEFKIRYKNGELALAEQQVLLYYWRIGGLVLKFIEKLKQFFGTKNHKHEIEYQKGFGYRCKWCDKPKSQCN